MRGVGRELAERRVDRDPIAEKDFRPGVVVKLSVHVGETGRDPRRKPDRTRHRHVELRVLVAVADARSRAPAARSAPRR